MDFDYGDQHDHTAEIIERVCKVIDKYRKGEEWVMTREELIHIAEDFNKWLEETAEKYGLDKDDVQSMIKQFLM